MNLIEKYSGYMPLTEDKITAIWADSIIILDTNVLLSLYRVNDTAKAEILAVLQELKGRLWMPSHVALEYSRNRIRVSQQSRKVYATLRSILEKTVIEIENLDRNLLPKEDKAELIKLVRSGLDGANNHIGTMESAHSDNSKTDTILLDIDALFGSSIGPGFTEAELAPIYKEGASRYAKSIPPGFGDDKRKPEPEKYGDLVIWHETIKHAASEKKNVIFVTDDKKNDWFAEVDESRSSARPELLQEFKNKAQQECLIYPSEEFFKIAAQFTHKEISGDTESEIERAGAQRGGTAGINLGNPNISDDLLRGERPALHYCRTQLAMLLTEVQSLIEQASRIRNEGIQNTQIIDIYVEKLTESKEKLQAFHSDFATLMSYNPELTSEIMSIFPLIKRNVDSVEELMRSCIIYRDLIDAV